MTHHTDAERRAPAAPVPQDAATHNKNLNGFIAFANQIDFAKPRSASLKRKFILETRDAILGLFSDNLKLHRKVDALSAAPQPPEAAPVRRPLTEDEIDRLTDEVDILYVSSGCGDYGSNRDAIVPFVRAIERAHGIGGAA